MFWEITESARTQPNAVYVLALASSYTIIAKPAAAAAVAEEDADS
jgi:hypothetical protein